MSDRVTRVQGPQRRRTARCPARGGPDRSHRRRHAPPQPDGPLRLGGGGGDPGGGGRAGRLRPDRSDRHPERSHRGDHGAPAWWRPWPRCPPRVFDAVGVTAPNPADRPHRAGRPAPPHLDGKPEVLFVGAEFCPFCAAERWPLIVALSRFGRFTALTTCSRRRSRSSRTSRPSVRGLHLHEPLPHLRRRRAVLRHASSRRDVRPHRHLDPGTGGGGDPLREPARSARRSIPFVDIANRMVTSTSGFSPAVLVQAVPGGHRRGPGPGPATRPARPWWPRPTSSPPGCARPPASSRARYAPARACGTRPLTLTTG